MVRDKGTESRGDKTASNFELLR